MLELVKPGTQYFCKSLNRVLTVVNYNEGYDLIFIGGLSGTSFMSNSEGHYPFSLTSFIRDIEGGYYTPVSSSSKTAPLQTFRCFSLN